MALLIIRPALPFQISIVFVITIIFCYRLFRRRNDQLPLPPGPKGLPLVGNIFDLPPPGRAEYLHWLEHKEKYGPLSSITVLGQPMIAIHDKTAADVILEKTSLKTSGRPKFTFANECGFNDLLPIRQYDAESKRHRKFIHQYLGTKKAVSAFDMIQDVESRRLLLNTLNDPDNIVDHFKTEASAIILKMTYGYSMGKESEDPLVNLIEKMMDNFSQAFVPLAWPVDLIPQLRHLPDGFPGTGYRKTAQAWRRVCQSVFNTPYNFVRMQMDSGVNTASYVSALVERLSNESENGKLSEVDEKTVKLTAAISYGGGADTTRSTLTSFVLAMLLFPKVQRKAQKEIDDALGAIRLPGFEDRERLPYVSALVKEALRWLPVLPIGTAHVVDEEFTYETYRIPKGAYLLPSIWSFLHDPEVYSDPSSFEPERFLGCRNEPDPAEHTFGYGRRICPGRFLAEESLFITISRVLATMNITRAVDANGRELEVKLEARPGLICHAAPFPYEIRPRSEEHADLIRSVERSHPWEISDAKSLSIC